MEKEWYQCPICLDLFPNDMGLCPRCGVRLERRNHSNEEPKKDAGRAAGSGCATVLSVLIVAGIILAAFLILVI